MIKICAVVGTDFFLFWAMNQNFTQIYGQRAILGSFVRKQNAFYGQSRLFGEFVRKTWSETPEFLRTNGHF